MPNFKLKQTSEQVQKAIDNALYPDKELTKEGVPADSKSVGIKIKKNSIHIGTEAPTNGETVWIDTDEETENDSTQIDVIAQPGQIIAVKEVDANGKPTKWEAIDLPKAKEPETPDFSANEGDAGYIKNRTHYVDEKGVIHKLPNMYIDAEWMATKEDGGAGKTVFIPEQTVINGTLKNLQGSLTEGVTYAVEVNGILYRCECRSYDGTLYLGNGTLLGGTEHNNEPFCISWVSGATGGLFYKNDNLSYPIGIKVSDWLDEIYNKLPKEFMPDISFEELTDKPFVEGMGELLYSQTVTFDTDNDSVKLAKISLTPKLDVVYWMDINGVLHKCHWEKSGVSYDLYDTEGNKWMQKNTLATYLYGQTAGTYTYNLYESSEIQMLDPKYIPANVAKKSDIPTGGGTGGASIDVTAEVGQTIVVKEIDADGKPTKWESADYQPRTHWKEVVELLPNTQAAFSEEDGFFIVEFGFDFVAGNDYSVNWNGVIYNCVAVDMDGGAVIGNVDAVAGTGDSGEPFFVIASEGSLIAVPLDGSAELVIGVSGEVYQTIDKNYLPRDTVYGSTEYSASVFDLELYCWQKGATSNIFEATSGFVNTEMTRANYDVLEEVFKKQIVFISSEGAFTKASHSIDGWQLQIKQLEIAPGIVAVKYTTLQFRWSDADNCVQRSVQDDLEYNLVIKTIV